MNIDSFIKYQPKSRDEARDHAIEFQHWSSNQSLSYSELAEAQSYFEELGNRLALTEEFKENGII